MEKWRIILVGLAISMFQTINFAKDVNLKNQFKEDKLHWRILVSKFNQSIPAEFRNLLDQSDVDLGMKREKNGWISLYTYEIYSFDKVKETLVELSDLGIENMKIISYYDSKVISFDEAQKIINGVEVNKLKPLNEIDGILADSFIYNSEAIYYKIWLGSFVENIPLTFADFIMELEENQHLISSEYNEDGIQNYYIDKIENYDTALNLIQQYKNMLWKEAKVLAYHKYNSISIEKAIQIKGE